MTDAELVEAGLKRSRLLFPDATLGARYQDKAGEWWAGVYQAGAKVDVIYLGPLGDEAPAPAVHEEAPKATLFD